MQKSLSQIKHKETETFRDTTINKVKHFAKDGLSVSNNNEALCLRLTSCKLALKFSQQPFDARRHTECQQDLSAYN